MRRIIFTLLICGLTFSAFSQSTAKDEKIKKLLELTGSAKLGNQILKSLIASYQKAQPNINQEYWTEFEKKFNTEELLINLIIPIYEKYYTEEDIDQLISFYNTPIGKKMIATAPLIMQESMTVGQNWGMQIAEKIAKELKESNKFSLYRK
jgi:hypothetical protein